MNNIYRFNDLPPEYKELAKVQFRLFKCGLIEELRKEGWNPEDWITPENDYFIIFDGIVQHSKFCVLWQEDLKKRIN